MKLLFDIAMTVIVAFCMVMMFALSEIIKRRDKEAITKEYYELFR